VKKVIRYRRSYTPYGGARSQLIDLVSPNAMAVVFLYRIIRRKLGRLRAGRRRVSQP
jgi:hypothetical protein